MGPLQGSETEANLRVAFTREAEAALRYRYFAQRAEVEGQPALAALFRSAADGEAGHALALVDFLVEIDDPVIGEPLDEADHQLRSAIGGERLESEVLYPRFAATARREGFTEIADWMDAMARAEDQLVERFADGPGSST